MASEKLWCICLNMCAESRSIVPSPSNSPSVPRSPSVLPKELDKMQLSLSGFSRTSPSTFTFNLHLRPSPPPLELLLRPGSEVSAHTSGRSSPHLQLTQVLMRIQSQDLVECFPAVLFGEFWHTALDISGTTHSAARKYF